MATCRAEDTFPMQEQDGHSLGKHKSEGQCPSWVRASLLHHYTGQFGAREGKALNLPQKLLE